MSLQQLKKEIQELRETIKPGEPGDKTIMTPEAVRCSAELETAKMRAIQRLKDSGISEKALNECERMGLSCDDEVIEAQHNLLRAVWNAKNPDKPPCEIKYFFENCSVEVENYKTAYDNLNKLEQIYEERTPEVIDAEYELLRAIRDVQKYGA